MGAHAERIAEALGDRLAIALPDFEWNTEHPVGGTPVDVAGHDDGITVVVEIEWRRADPSDNAAKLFRHLDEGLLEFDRVIIVQLFSRYYDLASGGPSSKRRNAEFVGGRAADAHDRLTYRSVGLDVVPPQRGRPLPDEWPAAVDAAAESITALV